MYKLSNKNKKPESIGFASNKQEHQSVSNFYSDISCLFIYLSIIAISLLSKRQRLSSKWFTKVKISKVNKAVKPWLVSFWQGLPKHSWINEIGARWLLVQLQAGGNAFGLSLSPSLPPSCGGLGFEKAGASWQLAQQQVVGRAFSCGFY